MVEITSNYSEEIILNKDLTEFLNVYKELEDYEVNLLPLCAAENISSYFTKLPQISFLQEKYLLGGVIKYKEDGNFCGSNKLYNIYDLFSKQCKKMFHCSYADARTLSGLNAVTTLLMSLFKIGDKIMITSEEYGGHSSMKIIANRLGLTTIEIPFNYENNDFDYPKMNQILENEKISGILIALSDIIEHPNLKKINLNKEILIYDVTQILGLIATNYIDNPLDWYNENENVILIGATHKTIPGPTCGLILTKNEILAKKIDLKINPDYLRNVQLNNIVSLLFSLYELESFGKEYFKVMSNIILKLTYLLENKGIKVIRTRNGDISKTHQMWLSINTLDLKELEKRAYSLGISFNIRHKKIYQSKGVRLGLQQIARYNWGDDAVEKISNIIYLLTRKNFNCKKIKNIIDLLPKKTIHFTFDNQTIEKFFTSLHNCDRK